MARPRRRLECLPETPEERACGGTTRPHAARPCPFVSCRHHLYLDVNESTGSIKLNFPDREVEELTHSCALDLADAGDMTLEEVGEHMNLTRERIRQLETRGFAKILAKAPEVLAELSPDDFVHAGDWDTSMQGVHGVGASMGRAGAAMPAVGIERRIFPRLVEHIAGAGGKISWNSPAIPAIAGREGSPHAVLARLAALGYGALHHGEFTLAVGVAAPVAE